MKNEKDLGADAAEVDGGMAASADPSATARHTDDARIYPCADCGVLRSKDEGGTTFTVCDDCWDKHYAAIAKAEGR